MRTAEEIVRRVEHVREDDLLGFRREVLLSYVPYDAAVRAVPAIAERITPEEWEPESPDSLEEHARRYLGFAIEKILDHRGISATRSVEKLTEYAWLLGRDVVVTAMGEAPYAWYGAPIVKVFATMLGWPWPDNPRLERMANGWLCRLYCDEGCGR